MTSGAVGDVKVTFGRAAFAGRWTIARIFEVRRGGPDGRFDGTATFAPLGSDSLRYDEIGVLRLTGATPMRAERAYVWRFAGEGVAVTFADGRPFHRFVPAAVALGTDHACGDDLYRVTYGFADWPGWSSCWTVTGPRKDYTMTTRYRPACAVPDVGAHKDATTS